MNRFPLRRLRRLQSLLGLEQANLSNVKGVGEGLLEYKINWGAGDRVYFGRDGGVLVILLMVGAKQRQQTDIAAAKATILLSLKTFSAKGSTPC